MPSPVVTCVVRLIGRRQPARGPYGSLPVRGDDRPVCGMTTQSPHPAKDNRRALLLRLPLQTAIDWTRIRPSNNWRQFRPRLGGRLLSEADELCGGDADNMDSTTDSFMRFLKTLPFASYCDIKCTRDRLRQCAIGTHINVASPCLPRVCEINDYHCNCNQNSKCLMSQHVSRKNDRITRV